MWVEACGVSDVEEGRPYHVEVNGAQLIVAKVSDNYYALDGICTHEYAELWLGFITDETITCPLHLSQFNLKTGEVISPPAEQPLRTYPVKIENQRVYIDI